MKQLSTFDLKLEGGTLSRVLGSGRKIPVEVYVDRENTILFLDCSCCEELLASKLPGGVLIPIASTLKTFFEGRGMRNVDVNADGTMMQRTYRGVLDKDAVDEMQDLLEEAVAEFIRKRKAT
ncbi:hypothetical protein EU538_06605 [Candidatus Thorarchaeota archaeon]|nr:MAG: hypothetical protein EU538_06605 [Candidatus Thorarchaeota archaeon]